MITYTWKVGKLTTLIQSNGQQNVISKARWACHGTDGTYLYQQTGICNIAFDPNDTFVEYDQLTEAEVLAWVWTTVDKTATESVIAQIIENQANPPYANLSLPWTAQ